MATTPTTMRAVVLDAPGPPDALRVRETPVPTLQAGEVLIKVEAFGLNRSELHTRLGLAQGVTFPRVLGIEATAAACPGREYTVGQQVAALMGGMGRTFDGGYAEYSCVPVRQVVPFVCFTGMLSNQWTVRDFYPIEYLPRGVRLTAYGGDATDLPTHVLQNFLDAIAAGDATVPIHRTYRLDNIALAHADMEAGRATGKLVVVL